MYFLSQSAVDYLCFFRKYLSIVIFSCFQILAHRGQHWTLLQNSCRTMWNCAHTALLRAIGPEDGLLSVDNLRAIVWFPMYTASDCLLDMLVHLQSDLEKHAEKVPHK